MAPEEEEVGPKIAFLKNNSWQDRYPQLNTFLICTLYILCHFTIFYQNAIPDTTRRQVYGKFTIANTELREHQVNVFFLEFRRQKSIFRYLLGVTAIATR